MGRRFADPVVPLLVVDDDVQLCELLTEYLEGEGFSVASAHDGESGLERALSGDYSLMVLDVMLPGIHGLEVLRRIRSESSLPVVMLTARGEEVDRIVGLEIGADDYLPKPFNPRELLARLRAVLRRAAPSEQPEENEGGPPALRLGDICLDGSRRTVTRAGEDVTLTAAEFDLLELFLRSVGQVVSRDEIAEQVLGRTLHAHDRSIDMHVSKLRRKLGPHPDGKERLKSIRSVGYLYTRPAGD